MGKQSGFLMMIIAILLVITAGLATAFVAMLASGANSSTSILTANNAYDLAETGIENGSYQLLLGTCNSSWSSTITVTGIGEYQYNCNPNQASTTITSALSSSSTSIPLASSANMDPFGAITIDSETIYYDGISGNNLLNAQRGQKGTTAAAHSLGAVVTQSQYLISSQSGAPSLSAPTGKVTLTQAVLLAKGGYYAVGTQSSNGVILSYNGTSWSTALTDSGVTIRGIDTSATYGLAVGSDSNTGYIYQFNGSSWSLFDTLSLATFMGVSCDISSPTLCWAVGQYRIFLGIFTVPLMYYVPTGAIEYVTNRGSVAVSTVSCAGGTCLAALPNDVFIFPINSSNPFANNPTNIGGTINDIDCAQNNRCVLVRSTGNIHYYNGSFWISTFFSNRTFNDVHCPTSSNCIVVGNSGVIYNCSLPITSASSCVQQSSPGTLNLQGVYCNATNDCLAVGTGNTAYRYTGTWTAITLPASYTLNSVSGVGAGAGSGVIPTVFHNQ